MYLPETLHKDNYSLTPRWKGPLSATKWRGASQGVGTNSAARQNSSTIHTPLGVSISPPKLRED